MAEKSYREEVFEVARLIVENSGGRARIAFQERDDSKGEDKRARHFIKVDEERFGFDLEDFCDAGEQTGDWKDALSCFYGNTLLFLELVDLNESFRVAGDRLKAIGHEVYEPYLLPLWDELFAVR